MSDVESFLAEVSVRADCLDGIRSSHRSFVFWEGEDEFRLTHINMNGRALIACRDALSDLIDAYLGGDEMCDEEEDDGDE